MHAYFLIISMRIYICPWLSFERGLKKIDGEKSQESFIFRAGGSNFYGTYISAHILIDTSVDFL